jgi:hypothetical protein
MYEQKHVDSVCTFVCDYLTFYEIEESIVLSSSIATYDSAEILEPLWVGWKFLNVMGKNKSIKMSI